MSRIVTIYCEGKKGSHDFDILSKIISDLPTSKTTVINIDPIGGIRGSGAIINYKETSGVVKSDFKILFRDRDFDLPIPDDCILEQDPERKYVYYSYRNTIENYLFDPSIFLEFIKIKALGSKYQINSEEDSRRKFIEAAQGIQYYQAVRHAMGKMRTGETNFVTKWTEKSGILPSDLSEKGCKKKALEKILKANSLASNWTEERFNAEFELFINKFNLDFMQNLDFLVYFQGKDFASYLLHLMPQFPIKQYYLFSKEHFNFKNFADLNQLYDLIQSQV